MIFGESYPKLQDIDTSNYLELPYSVVEPPAVLTTPIEQETLSGEVEYVYLHDYDNIEVKIEVNLWKYGDLTVRRAKYSEIYSYNHKDVYLYIASDGIAFKDADGNKVKFTVVKVELWWKVKPQLYDTLTITLRSKKPVKLDTFA